MVTVKIMKFIWPVTYTTILITIEQKTTNTDTSTLHLTPHSMLSKQESHNPSQFSFNEKYT